LKSIKGLSHDKSEARQRLFTTSSTSILLDGYDLMRVPTKHTKRIAAQRSRPRKMSRLVEHFEKDGQTVYEAAIKNGLEGVVAKRKAGIL